MSYILEALRKADAERDRERSGVPGLNAQPLAAGSGNAEAAGTAWSWAAAGATVAVLGFAGGLAWWALARSAAPATPAALAVVPAPAVAPPPAAPTFVPPPAVTAAPPQLPKAVSPAPTSPSTVSTAPPTPAPPAARVLSAAPPSQAARPAEPKAVAAAPRAATKPAAPPAASAAASTAAVPATPAASASGEARVHALAELPADVRRTLPPLSIGGLVYSDSAASRFVILNGQVFHEGSRPAEGVVLEQIRRKSAVLSHRGYRVELPY